MARATRSDNWGFPRWGGYGAAREATTVRICDRYGCEERGECPAPKSPNSPERWMFCRDHAAEYNRSWDYFEGLTAEEAVAREADERRDAGGFSDSKYYGWGGPGDGSRSRDEMRALDVLGLDSDAEFDAVRTAWRTLAKAHHPDLKPDDAAAAQRFREIQAAYDVLKAADDARNWKPL
ncbi:MAG: J domain-containing protein [Pseudomonadota bacterium]